MTDRKFTEAYELWREKRINAILAHYGADFFKGKTLLEVGAGYGDIGAYFLNLGATVTCTEGRSEYVQVIQERHPGIIAKVQDLEEPWNPDEKFDIIIHFGVLYHLHPDKVERALTDACWASNHLILETEVLDSPDDETRSVDEPFGWDQALHKIGNRPSPVFVEHVLSDNGMTFERVTDDRCNAIWHVYDWPSENNKKHRDGLRRFWFCKR